MKRDYLFLGLTSLVLCIIFLLIQKSPGYMDAEYHTSVGYHISEGKGLYEPFVWNYLDSPKSLIHPSHTYWMPLPSLVAALGFAIIKMRVFFGARLFFVVFSLFVPIVTYKVALKLRLERSNALLAGLISIFSGYYAVYSTIPDSFGITMLCGGCIFLAVETFIEQADKSKKILFSSVVIGVSTGFLHLSRTEGLLWFLSAFLLLLIIGIKKKIRIPNIVLYLSLNLISYLSIMGFWYIRNVQIFGRLFPPGNNYTIFVSNYDQLFSFHPYAITLSNWVTRSLPEIINPIAKAISVIFGTIVGSQTMVFLLPFFIIGYINVKKRESLIYFSVMLIVIVVLMGIIFPFAGTRGGYFHASAAFQPIIWVISVVGINQVTPWLASKFTKINIMIPKLLLFSMIFIAILTTAFISFRVIFAYLQSKNVAWSENEQKFKYLEQVLIDLKIPKDAILTLTNPPGLFWATNRSAIVTPYEGENELVDAAKKYHSGFLILEPNHLESMHDIYIEPEDTEYLKYIGSYNYGIQIYSIQIEQ